MRRLSAGFTVIELLVVLAAMGLLLSIAAPRYFGHVDAAKEVALRQDLFQLRDAIDKFQGDQGKYPASIADLVDKHYLRDIPMDPMTERADTWVMVYQDGQAGAVADVRSGAKGVGRDGKSYSTW